MRTHPVLWRELGNGCSKPEVIDFLSWWDGR